ncbi:GNAT family N-acetyltransferase [Erythrobacter sp. MTPC3]|uniref:GNAT family N-acetyltransferase n=1 Tax=Erythrobacter sp. MTPC3 TaxID=3056564 RepID=UPI0036F19798
MMAYAIRDFRSEDAVPVAALTLKAIHEVGAQSYNPEQVAAWAAHHPAPERFTERASAGAHIKVAANADDIAVAYALLEPDGHLDMLYCHPDHTRRGLADELLAECEMKARTLSLTRLYTEASDLARPAFERAGYAMQHRRDFTIGLAGKAVPIHNYAMEKPLN